MRRAAKGTLVLGTLLIAAAALWLGLDRLVRDPHTSPDSGVTAAKAPPAKEPVRTLPAPSPDEQSSNPADGPAKPTESPIDPSPSDVPAPSDEPAADVGAAVEGVVVDADGKPLADAEVKAASVADNAIDNGRVLLGSRSAFTDASGKFRVAGLAEGPIFLVAEWRDVPRHVFLATRQRLSISAPASGVRVELWRLGGLRMRLLTPDGKPFAGGVTTTVGNVRGAREVTFPVYDGVVTDYRLDDGPWTWRVAARGFAWIEKEVVIEGGKTIDFGDVVVDPGVEASGRVIDSGGRGIASARIQWVESDARDTKSDADGRFVLVHLPREPIEFQVAAQGYVTTQFTVDPTRTTGLEWRLARRARVRVAVKVGDGSVPKDIDLLLHPKGARLRRETALGHDGKPETYEYFEGSEDFVRGEDGVFAVDHLPPGAYVVKRVLADETQQSLGEVQVAEGETKEITVTLPAK